MRIEVEMEPFNIGLLAVAGSALVQGMFSKPLQRLGLPDSVTLLLIGVALGPVGFGLLDPAAWGNEMAILEQVARLALAIGLMGIALRLPKRYVFENWRTLAAVLLVGMPFMWLCSSALAGWTLGLSAGVALLIGAAVTPTDPVIASAVVSGPVAQEKLPAHLRQIISSESGANDGLAYLFVLAAVFVLTLSPQESMSLAVLGVLLGDVIAALVSGVVIGYTAGFALRKAEQKRVIEQSSLLMMTTALALTTLALVKLLGSDGILAVFAAGLAFDQQVGVRDRQEEGRVVEGVDRFFTSPVIILLGLMLPTEEWLQLGWPLAALAAAVLLLRRLPLFIALGGHLRGLPTRLDGSFSGWFGPVGVAALYYAAMAHHKVQIPELWPVVSFLVVTSILVHGLTAMPLSHLYRNLELQWKRRGKIN